MRARASLGGTNVADEVGVGEHARNLRHENLDVLLRNPRRHLAVEAPGRYIAQLGGELSVVSARAL